MTNQSRNTVTHPFFNYSADRNDTLFTVREGIPFETLLEQLQCFLKSAHANIENIACESRMDQPCDCNALFGASYLTEICLALATACVNSLEKESKS